MINVLVQRLAAGMVVADARTYTRWTVSHVEPSSLPGLMVVHFTNGRRSVVEVGESFVVVSGHR